jgi:hypothetical protein
MWLIFDNFCVAIGVVVLWLCRGCSYSLRGECHKIHEGLLKPNFLECFIGGAILLLISGVAVLIQLVYAISERF